jgi:hypothetical protein
LPWDVCLEDLKGVPNLQKFSTPTYRKGYGKKKVERERTEPVFMITHKTWLKGRTFCQI